MKRALFIGRFQPFHLGHLSVIKEMDKRDDIDEIIVGIGSSQYENTDDNPYTFIERELMINRGLKDEIVKPYNVIAVPDIHNDILWVDHVESIVGETSVVYTGNTWVQDLFQKKKYEVVSVDIKKGISGTKLRKLIREDNKQWQEHVCKNIISIIKNAQSRIN